MKKDPTNPIRRAIQLLSEMPAGTLLDVGTGAGELAKAMVDRGFKATACDVYEADFKYHGQIPFVKANFDEHWPFTQGTFDYVVCLEVIEHMANPSQLISNLSKALRPGGLLILSTPNILSMKSRLRFFTEGAWEYFREPLLERSHLDYTNPKEHFHIAPLRVHEIEFFFHLAGLDVEAFKTTKFYAGLRYGLFPLEWLVRLQARMKIWRTSRKGDILYHRIMRTILAPEVLYGQHLVVLARKRAPGNKPASSQKPTPPVEFLSVVFPRHVGSVTRIPLFFLPS